MKHLEQYVALNGHSVSAGCLSWFMWFSQSISTECLLRVKHWTERHIDSPHPEDGLLESSYHPRNSSLSVSEETETPKQLHCHAVSHKWQRWKPNAVLSALEIWARWQAQKLVVLTCVLFSGKSETWSALPASGTGTCARASAPACTRLHMQYSSEKLPQRLCPWLTLHPTISGQKGIFPE